MGKFLGFLFKLFGILCFILLLGLAGAFYTAQTLLTSSDTPMPSEAIIPLGGSFTTPLHAAELHKRGLAPVIFVGHFAQSLDEKTLVDLGYTLPTPEAVYVRILQEEGVQQDAIRLFGQELPGQIEEAQALAAKLNVPNTLIVITTPYNVRLTKMIYSDVFPTTDVRVVGTPFEPLPARWWESASAIRAVASETAAIVHYYITRRLFGD